MLVDKEKRKVVIVEATKDFIESLFSFLCLPLATIVHLLETNNIDIDLQPPSSFFSKIKNLYQTLLATNLESSESSPFLANIKHLYQTVKNSSNEIWNNPLSKQMLLHPKNPCESHCMKLFLNIDDTKPKNKFFCV